MSEHVRDARELNTPLESLEQHEVSMSVTIHQWLNNCCRAASNCSRRPSSTSDRPFEFPHPARD
jgi:hypothetical protein